MNTIELTDKEVQVIRRALGWYYDETCSDEQLSAIIEVAPKFGLSFEEGAN